MASQRAAAAATVGGGTWVAAWLAMNYGSGAAPAEGPRPVLARPQQAVGDGFMQFFASADEGFSEHHEAAARGVSQHNTETIWERLERSLAGTETHSSLAQHARVARSCEASLLRGMPRLLSPAQVPVALAESTGSLPSLDPNAAKDDDHDYSKDETIQERFERFVGAVGKTIGLGGEEAAKGGAGGATFISEKERLLPAQLPEPFRRPYTLVIDLKSLVHTTWTQRRGWTSKKRAGVDFFLSHLSNFYEIVVFSDEPASTARAIIDRIDTQGYISHRLYKEQMTKTKAGLTKDLKNLGRDMSKVIMMDIDAKSFDAQPATCMLLKPWSGEDEDTVLLDLIPFLDAIAQQQTEDVREVVKTYRGQDAAEVWRKHRLAREQATAPTDAQKAGTVWDKFK